MEPTNRGCGAGEVVYNAPTRLLVPILLPGAVCQDPYIETDAQK
jgi:hypothetical protein